MTATSTKSPQGGERHGPNRIASEALLGPHREVVIVHNGREYRLRLTQNGKLILTA
jgi:hemin uptake protein HemP